MNITLNGQPRELADAVSVTSLLGQCGFDGGRVAVVLNGEIVVRRDFAAAMIKDGDAVEVVAFVGGG